MYNSVGVLTGGILIGCVNRVCCVDRVCCIDRVCCVDRVCSAVPTNGEVMGRVDKVY